MTRHAEVRKTCASDGRGLDWDVGHHTHAGLGKDMRRRVLPLLFVAGTVSCAACGSTTSTSPASSTSSTEQSLASGSPHVIVLSGSTVATKTAEVGDLVEVELTSHSYGRNGTIIPWSTPTSVHPAILAPTRA